MVTTSCAPGRFNSSETTALPKWPLAPLTPTFMSTPETFMAFLLGRVVFSGCCRDCHIRPSPRGKLRRLPASDFVGQGKCVARVRTQVRVGLKVGEHLRDIFGAWKKAGEELLRDLLEREVVTLSIQRGDDFVEAEEVADQRQMFTVTRKL